MGKNEQNNHKPESNLVKDGEVIATTKPVPAKFGAVKINLVDRENVFKNRDDRSTSLVTFEVAVPILGGSLYGSVYMRRLDENPTRPFFDVSLSSGSRGAASAFRFNSPDAKKAFRAHVNAAIMAWPGWDAVCDAGWERLNAEPKPVAAASADSPEQPVELGWVPKTSQPAQSAETVSA